MKIPRGKSSSRGIFLRRVNPEKALTAEDAEENKNDGFVKSLPCRHCEERSDAAISVFHSVMKDEIASLRSQRRLKGFFSDLLNGKTLGLLINFNVVHLKDGIKRIANGL
jgi:hypothetical protein